VKIFVGTIGKLKEPYFVAAEDEYRKRLRPYCTLTVHEAKDEAALLRALPDGAQLYVFDERGESVTSAQFAELLAAEAQHGKGTPLAFLIGGAEGHAEPLLKKANLVLSFGAMTWPHLLARAMLAEQIYRAQQLLAGHPYHRA